MFFLARTMFAALMLLALTPSAFAQTVTRNPALDELFTTLQAAPDVQTANRAAAQIWQRWFSPDDQLLAERMNEMTAARASFDMKRTMELLNKIVIDFPDYAEGWNRRATLNFEFGNYEESLADIAETLKREPRHFGALSGQALVYLSLGNTEKARQAVEAARKIHPFIANNPPLSDLVEPRLRV